MTVCSKDRISIPFFVLFLGLFLLVSCRKNEDTVGSDFIGALVGFNVQSSDTASVVAYTSVHDSLITNRLSYFMLGSMNDPEIGTTKAAIASQVELPYDAFPVFNTLTIDSIVLQLKYASSASFFGNKSTLQTIKVYEINEDLPSTGLYSNKTYAVNSVPLGTWTSDYTHLGDSVPLIINGQPVTLAPHIRIKLDDPSFVAKIKNASPADFLTSTTFKTFMKGLYIAPETSPSSGQGALAYMNMNSVTTAMVIYYNNGTAKAEFPVYSSTALKGNSFVHTNLPAVTTQPSMGGTHRDTCYIKPGAGLKTRILFPYLFDFAKTKNIAITGAEVVISVDRTRDTSVYKLPGWLLLNTSDSTGKYDFPLDLYTSDGIDYYGGYYNGLRGEYRFNIQRQVQYWFNQYKKTGLNYNYGLNLIVPADNPVSGNRAILDTRPGKIKLKLSYTVIK